MQSKKLTKYIKTRSIFISIFLKLKIKYLLKINLIVYSNKKAKIDNYNNKLFNINNYNRLSNFDNYKNRLLDTNNNKFEFNKNYKIIVNYIST